MVSMNIADNMNNSSNTPSHFKYSLWRTHWSIIPRYAFGVFIVTVIIIAALTVYFTSPRVTFHCQISFVRSIKRASVYDSRPHQVTLGTFNKDKYLDLVVANSGTDCIGVLLGYGNGTFATQITHSTGFGSRPYSVSVGDFNNDTELDIVVANHGTNSISVFLGYGDGDFAKPIFTSLGSSRPLFVAVGDLNNDKQLDIAVVNYGTSSIAILIGDNAGSFKIDTIYPTGYDSIPYTIALADLNKDHVLDLAIVNYGTNELVIILRKENQTLLTQTYSTGLNSHPISIGIKDFHNDHTLDIIVVCSGTSKIEYFRGYGDGRFMNLMAFSTGANSHPRSAIISDFNNDTQLDIVVSDITNNTVLVFKGNTNGSFSLITTQSTGQNSGPLSMIAGDFDNDNRLDIAVANNGTNDILILTSFSIYPTCLVTNYGTEKDSAPWSVDVYDLNNDNYLDFVVPYNGGDNIGVFINLGNGMFKDQQTYYMGNRSAPGFVTIGDFNNDNYSDIVVVLHIAGKIGILLGDGDGTFRHGEMYSTGVKSLPYTAHVADFNSDKNLDIVIADYFGTVGIYFGYGDGTFTEIALVFPKGMIHSKCTGTGDFNNDNIPDIAVSDRKSGHIIVLLGYGNGSFQNPHFTSTASDRPNAFTVGDLNDDNQLDIVYSDALFAHIGVLLGYGNGTFGCLIQYTTVHGSYPWYISLGYYNNDALIDIAVGASYDSSIHIFLGIGNGSFGTPIQLSTGYNSIPWSVMFADFDNDHQDDLVVANDRTNDILIFSVHNYEADFVNEISYTIGSVPHPSSATVADLDNDGRSDIVVATSDHNNIEMLFHYDKGIFLNRTILSTDYGSHPQAVITADFNGDHLLDIAVVNAWHDTLNVFLQFNDGSFDTKFTYSTGFASTPSSIAIGDLNTDGRMDIVVANENTDNIAVFLAHDYVIYTHHTTCILDILPRPADIARGDFNNDGHVDLVVANIDPSVLNIYLGYGNGTFFQSSTQPTGSKTKPSALAVGDLNHDAYLDIVVIVSNASSIYIFLGLGNGTFQSAIEYSTGMASKPSSVAIADFNNDNQSDIVVVNQNSSTICIFSGDENGTFIEQLILSMPIGSSSTWLTVSDIDRDAFLDIIVTNVDANNVGILFGYGNGSFANIRTLSTGSDSGPCSLAIGDVNKDYVLDVVVANRLSKNIGIFFGSDNSTFSLQEIVLHDSEFNLASIVVSDVNNDTILDILIAGYNQSNSSIGILYGYGDGNFTLPTIYQTSSVTWSKSIVVDDFDNDGYIDLAVTHYYLGTIDIMLQRKFQPFASSELFSTGKYSRPKSLVVADLNNDDEPDIVVANSGTDNIGILLGYGNGKFSHPLTYLTGNHSLPSSLATGDFNRDHYLDIVVANAAADSIGLLFGYGNGTFGNMVTYFTGIHSNSCSVAVNDLNMDNYLDLVVTNWGMNNVLVFFGEENGTFLEPKHYPLGYDARPKSVAIGDMNNDHLLDIVVVNDGADYLEILLQTC